MHRWHPTVERRLGLSRCSKHARMFKKYMLLDFKMFTLHHSVHMICSHPVWVFWSFVLFCFDTFLCPLWVNGHDLNRVTPTRCFNYYGALSSISLDPPNGLTPSWYFPRWWTLVYSTYLLDLSSPFQSYNVDCGKCTRMQHELLNSEYANRIIMLTL